MKPNISLFFGGLSAEHEVSLISAGFIFQQLRSIGYNVLPIYVNRQSEWFLVEPEQTKITDSALKIKASYSAGHLFIASEGAEHKVDFVFPIIHGTRGEDGSIQGLARFYNLPYAGCSVAASAVCMDKVLAKKCFAEAGIPQLPYVAFDQFQYNQQPDTVFGKIIDLGFPVFLKPCNMGSSVGIRKVKTLAELKSAVEHALLFDFYIVAEKAGDIRELEIAIMGEPGTYELSSIGEIGSNQEFYSYSAKYQDENGASLLIDPKLAPEIKDRVEHFSREAFAAVRGEGFARIDFFLDKSSGELYLNEINTLPGFTPISMFPKLFEHKGIRPGRQLDLIVKHGISRFEREQRLLLKED